MAYGPVTIEQALAVLETQLHKGLEFPDAVWWVTSRFGVDQAALEAAYDARPVSLYGVIRV